MKFNFTKSIVFICLLAILNSCGIGRYHSLNFVRPDKNTITSLVKHKHKTNKVKIEYNVDSVIAQTTEEDGLTETANIVFEKKTNVTNIITKKSTNNKLIEKHSLNRLINKKLYHTPSFKMENIVKTIPEDGPLPAVIMAVVVITISVILLFAGLIMLAINQTVGLWLLIPNALFWLIILISIIAN